MLQCAILCGGLATRLRPLTETIPKSLITIGSEPFVFHQLRLLQSRGVRSAVLCVGYLGEMIEEAVGDGSRFGMDVRYSFDGPTLRGTAGAIINALPLLDDSFFVLYGDSYLPCDYADIAAAFERSQKPAMMTIFRNEGEFDTSNVEASDGMILRYDKQDRKPSMRHIDYGLGVFKRNVFTALPQDQTQDLAGVYQQLLGRGELAAYEVQQRFYEIGSTRGIADLETYLSPEVDASKDLSTRSLS